MSNFIKQNNIWIIKISSQSSFLALTQLITLVKKLFEICNRCQTTVFSLFSLIVVLALHWKNISFPNRNGQEVSEVNNGLANYPQTTIALTDLHISILYHLVKSLHHKKKIRCFPFVPSVLPYGYGHRNQISTHVEVSDATRRH